MKKSDSSASFVMDHCVFVCVCVGKLGVYEFRREPAIPLSFLRGSDHSLWSLFVFGKP